MRPFVVLLAATLQLKGLNQFTHFPLLFSSYEAEIDFRYLTAIDPSYYDGLSDASKKSLALQGGPFQGEELEAFESDPLKEDMVRLRKWDDKSKIVGIVEQTPRADIYGSIIRKHLER